MFTQIEKNVITETSEDIFLCRIDPNAKEGSYASFAVVLRKLEGEYDYEMSIEEAAEKLNVPVNFLGDLISSLTIAMRNIISDFGSCWIRMDELEERIKKLEEKK